MTRSDKLVLLAGITTVSSFFNVTPARATIAEATKTREVMATDEPTASLPERARLAGV